MMSNENYDNYDQDERNYHAAADSINSELLEKKDPAVNQHENDTTGIHKDTYENHNHTDPDDRDPDADRRTLDEEKAVEDDDEED
ncbi:hypothetical protein [Flavobacterium sp. ACN6]|uniref:hypothetical protein n=1 Tax=Flavobacterium sp. ACN6 TaxID=1920426 RepID=UPI001143DB61|nr:hypothetical protein [Flavobacterium sp. ACN6]PBJ05615.1 hypothetical protein BSF42_42590 [Flavobacterium sp. ACN6]